MRLTRAVLPTLLFIAALPLSAQQIPTRPDSARRDSVRPVQVQAVVIGATRSERRVEDEPLRVEVLSAEEVGEKVMMTPGDIAMMLNETTGLRVQTVAPGLGSANVRVQGLRGRYTQILTDGLPLHGAQTGGIGLLQIPPMDLGGVEVIKGVSSALYGGSALGGVINLVSRRPGDEPMRDLLLNRTSLGGSDVVGFAGNALGERWGYTMLVSSHGQDRQDLDGDRWADVPQYERTVLRPRLYWNSENGHRVMLTAGYTDEDRRGGTVPDEALATTGTPWPEALRTKRFDAGLTGRWLVGSVVVASRASYATQDHRHRYASVVENDEHGTGFAEVSLTGAALRGVWVLGAAYQHEQYANADVNGFDYTFTTPGLFAQHTVDLGPVALSGSGRVDGHSEYGTQVSPRLSALVRLDDGWSLRASLGEGFFAPTPFTEEVEAVGLSRLSVLTGLGAERGRSASFDVSRSVGDIELLASLFGSRITNPVAARASTHVPDGIELVALARPTTTTGVELALRAHPEPFHFSVGYTWLQSREDNPELGVRRDVALNPRHSVGALAAWEKDDVGRAGIELYFTGRQALADDPFSNESEAYVHLGVLVERHIGPVRVFINGENLLDYRQTRTASLLRPQIGAGGRATTDVWGPLEGRVVNIGLRF